MSATTNLGKVSVTPKGAWAITNTYEILDIVTSGGSSYLAKQDVPTGVPLTNTSYWIMIAEKGDGGEVTSASASISGGYGTPGVTVTAGGTAHERTLAFAFTNLRGEKGETGNGIDSVYKTGTSGLVDTYTILFTDGSTYEFEVNNGTASIDDTLTKSGWAADAKAVGDTKASIDGFYETMGVGVADNLTPYSEDSGASQDIPFIAQGTGCGNGESVVDTGSYCQFKKKLGNTVGVNQLHSGQTRTDRGITATWNSSTQTYTLSGETESSYAQIFGSIPLVAGRDYISIGIVLKNPNNISFNMGMLAGATQLNADNKIKSYSVSTTANKYAGISGLTVGTDLAGIEVSFVMMDVSLWFGSNDRIPSDLLAHPENWGRYYAGSLAYNAGTLESADGTVLRSIGRNQWDEVAESGRINLTTGANSSGNGLRSKNYIPAIPNTEYYAKAGSYTGGNAILVCYYDASQNYIGYDNKNGLAVTFTTPSNCCFMRFNIQTSAAVTYNHDITISLYYPGESGYDQYYPYSVLAEVDTGSEVLRSAGAVADEKTPDGMITRRVKELTVTQFTGAWGAQTNGYGVYLTVPDKDQSSSRRGFVKSNRFTGSFDALPNMPLYSAGGGSGAGTTVSFILPSSVTSLAEANTWLTNNPTTIYYVLATPTTEQGTAFAENIPCDDFGSMYWTQTKGIPQGNEIFYPVDYKASIDTLYNRVEGDMGAIVIDSQLEVVADRIPEAPSEDGTYTLKATVSSGTKTYSWVADE